MQEKLFKTMFFLQLAYIKIVLKSITKVNCSAFNYLYWSCYDYMFFATMFNLQTKQTRIFIFRQSLAGVCKAFVEFQQQIRTKSKLVCVEMWFLILFRIMERKFKFTHSGNINNVNKNCIEKFQNIVRIIIILSYLKINKTSSIFK